jgi:4-coumarate--CoA ligase
VSPAELESLLFIHPAVADCAVIGKPNSYAGEIPKAFVVKKQGMMTTATEIIDFVKGRIADYKWIREVEFVDSIPRTQSGKILRKILIERERTNASQV